MAYKINTAVVGFGIGHFIAVADGSAITTGTPTCGRIIDGVHGACANAAVYTTSAWEIDLVAGDMNGTNIILTFSLAGAIPISYTIKTETKLVSELKDETMVGTDGANITTPPTVTEIQAAMEEDGASILDLILDLLPGTTIAAANDIPAMVGTNNALLAASVTIADGAIKADLTHIHGTALTETAGQLAAAFKKFFDVATPLLVASTVMRGTDGVSLVIPDAVGTAASLHGTTNGKVDAVQSDVTIIKNKTDGLNFTGTDVKATLDGEEVVTDAASRTASKAGAADVAGAEVDVTAIHGSPLAEDSAANLADNFSAFYNNGDSAPTLQTVDDVGGGVSTIALTTLVKAVITPDTVFTVDEGSTEDNYYRNMIVSIIDKSTGEINSRRISGYSGATRQITVDLDFEFPIEDNPGDEDAVIIWANAYTPAAGTAAAGAIATAVWAALRAANNDPGSMGQIHGVHGWCGT